MNPAETAFSRIKKRPAIRGLFRFLFPVNRPAVALLGALGVALSASAQTYNFTTMAGIGGAIGYNNGSGGGIGFPLFSSPSGVVVNKSGNLYVVDVGNHLIREVTPAGAVTTLAGTAGQAGTLDGTGISARVGTPLGPAVDTAGNLYFADFAAHTVRKVTPAGVVTTVAGTGSAGSVDGTGTAAAFNQPSGVAVDSGGNIYVADSSNSMIRKITTAGVVSVYAGAAGAPGSTDATTATAARFFYPRSIVFDSAGNLFVADARNNSIRKIKASGGEVTTFAGAAGTFGSADGTGTAARFSFPNSLAIDSSDNLYVADELNQTVRKITPGGVVTTLAGQPGSAGFLDGTGSAAQFNDPSGIAVDASGNIYVAEHNNQLIRKITPAGVVTTVAGVLKVAGTLDGLGYNLTPTQFANPSGTAVDGAGNVYVADTANALIRKVTKDGVVSTVAGNLSTIFANGTATVATFNSPSGITTNSAGDLYYVADTANHLIRKITGDGTTSTFAGTVGVAGSADTASGTTSFNYPTGVALDSGGTLYVADYENHVIRRITSDGTVTTFAGSAGSQGSSDGVGSSARFKFPRNVAVDNAGNVYVADTGNNTIRKISPGGTVQTLAGTAGLSGSADGIGAAARFNAPAGLTVDGSSNVFVSDSSNSTIRMITIAGVVTTIGGTANSASNVDGAGAAARFDHPIGIAVDTLGNLYIADTRNQTIRKGSTSAPGSPSPGTGGTSGGTGPGGLGGNGGISGPSTPNTGSGFLLRPVGVANNPAGGLYVVDTANNSIKAIASDGIVTVLAGKDGTAGSADGTGGAASFNNPTGIAVDASGVLYICDTGNGMIRKITSTGVVTTLAGSASTRGNQDGTGTAASFMAPTGITINAATDLFVTDSTNNTIRKITTAGVVTTFAGTAKSVGDADGAGAAARFNNPTGITIDGSGFLYVADTNNHTIRRINSLDIAASTDGSVPAVPAGKVTTRAGSPGITGAFDGVGAYALFNSPMGVSADGNANVYIADTGNNCIRVMNSAGGVGTVAGIAGISGNRDGTFTSALFNQPQGVLVSSALVVTDTGNSVLRTIGAKSVFTVNLKAATTTTPGTGGGSSGSSSGGGGSMEPWFVTALAASALALRSRRRASKA